jgi:hypothetical protein
MIITFLKKAPVALSIFLLSFFCLSSFDTQAQGFDSGEADMYEPNVKEDFSDEELNMFVNATKEVIRIQQETERLMINIIEEEDLTVDKFNEIMIAQQTANMDRVDATAEELIAFNNAAEKIMMLQNELQEEVIRILESEGIDVETYQEIILSYQYSPQVQERVNEMLELE